MLTRFVRGQLTVFALITAVALIIGSVVYLDVPRLLGFHQNHMSTRMPIAGGLYPNAVVTLRGVQVGKVTDVRVDRGQVVSDLAIDDDKSIPNSVRARVHSTSAIGEQYLDLQPQGRSTGTLADGARIPAARDPAPVDTATLLNTANGLIASIPRDSLATVVNESARAFNGSADNLQRILDASGQLLEGAHDALGPTKSLIANLVPVLQTQQQTGADLRGYTTDLASFTRQLALSDSDIRAILAHGPEFAATMRGAVSDLRPTLPSLLSDLGAVGQVLTVYLPHTTQILSIFPALVQMINSAATPYKSEQSAALNFRTAVNDPGPCLTGFEHTVERDPSDTTPRTTNGNAYCRAPANSPMAVRGARNTPCPDDPGRRSPDAAGCGLVFERERAGDSRPAVTPRTEAASRLIGSDGIAYLLGGPGTSAQAPTSWESLLLGPLGR